MQIKTITFGYIDGIEIKQFILENDRNLKVKIINYGGIITGIEMPDRNGKIDNIVCGFDKMDTYISEEYLENYPYFGAIIGRNANRIDKGHLKIDSNTYQLATNNGNNHLHGGNTGFDKHIWKYEVLNYDDIVGVKLSRFSPDMEENYPGNLEVECIYSLNNKNELSIDFFAKTDKPTIVNLTNHTYFNLTGGKENILGHELKLNSDKITATNDSIPTGEIVSVADTPHDFTRFKSIKEHIDKLPTGYDDNYVLNKHNDKLQFAASLKERTSGHRVDIYTTQPGIQLYTGYWIPELKINNDRKFGKYSGIALETQHFPDAVHHKNFPSTILNPGEEYRQNTVFRFVG